MALTKKISQLVQILAGKLTDLAKIPMVDSDGVTRYGTVAQLRTQIETGFVAPLADQAVLAKTASGATSMPGAGSPATMFSLPNDGQRVLLTIIGRSGTGARWTGIVVNNASAIGVDPLTSGGGFTVSGSGTNVQCAHASAISAQWSYVLLGTN